jgi:hypothetical protein
MREKRNAYRILIGEREGKRTLRRPRHRRVDLRWNGIVWTGFIWLRDRDWEQMLRSS